MDKNKYRKHFIALESNPEVFTKLSHKLGVSEAFCFVDVLSLDLVEMLPRPALALILTFPTSAEYERHKSTEDAEREEYTEIDEDGVIWLPQTINNACGLYALLHAVFNSEARHLIHPKSLLGHLLDDISTMKPQDRAQILEDSAELESIYAEFAEEGDSSVPANAEEEVDFHFICFAKNKHSTIYELDGDQKGPIDKGVRLGPEDDMLSEASLSLIKDYLDREAGANICFNLMALVKTESLLGV